MSTTEKNTTIPNVYIKRLSYEGTNNAEYCSGCGKGVQVVFLLVGASQGHFLRFCEDCRHLAIVALTAAKEAS